MMTISDSNKFWLNSIHLYKFVTYLIFYLSEENDTFLLKPLFLKMNQMNPNSLNLKRSLYPKHLL